MEQNKEERKSCIFSWKLELKKDQREEILNYLSTYLPNIVLLSLSKNFLAYSIAFYPPIRNASMQRDFTNPSYIFL